MKQIILIVAAVFMAVSAYAQFPNTTNKLRLGIQTTGDGLIYRHSGTPSWTPTGINNAWQSIDTLTGDLYTYRGGTWFLEVKGDLQQVYPLVINKTGSPILRGQVVGVDTSQIVQGDQIRIMPAIGDGGLSSNLIMGVAANDIADNASGYVAWFGYVREVDQTDIAQTGITLNVGDILYLSATEPGRLTNVEPTPPALKTTIALVVRKPNANNMTLLVRPKLNEDLRDLNDVDLNGINNGQTIVWDSINTKWIAGDVGSAIDTTTIATKFYVDSKVDSTRLVSDSILVYYIGGVELRRDTLSLPPAGVTSITAGVGLTGGTITSTGTIAADTAGVLVTKTFLTNQGYTTNTGTITGSGTSGQVSYWNGTSSQTGNNNLFWDISNSRLGIGTNAPASTLQVTGITTLRGTSSTDAATLSANVLSKAGWGGYGVNWTTLDTAAFTHVTGNTGTLTHTHTPAAEFGYQIDYTVAGRTAGSFTITYGGYASGNITATGSVSPVATSSATLVVTPTSDFNGTVTIVIRVISFSSEIVSFRNSSNFAVNQIRASGSNTNIFMGLNAGRYNVSGTSNTFIGSFSGRHNTTGSNNTFYGFESGRDNTFGVNNTFVGALAGQRTTSGSNNSFFGYNVGQLNSTGSFQNIFGVGSGAANTTGTANSFFGYNVANTNTTGSSNAGFGNTAIQLNTTGSFNAAFGAGSGFWNRTGSNNTFFGYYAGRDTNPGTGANNINSSVLIGFDARVQQDSQTNQIVIGADSRGNGSNTATIGNTSMVGYFLNGTGHLRVPSGTTAQRPGTPTVGMMRNNTSNNNLDFYTGTAWENPLKSATATGLGTAGRVFYADANGRAAGALVGSGLTLSNDTLRVTSPNGVTDLSFVQASPSLFQLASSTGTDVAFSEGDGIDLSLSGTTLSVGRASPIYAVVTVDSNRTSTFLAASVTPDTIDNPKISQVGGVFSVVGNGIQYTSGTARTFLITANADFKFSEANNVVKFQGWRSNGGTVIDLGTFGTVESVLGNETMHTSFSAITSLSNNDLLRFGFTPGAHTGDDTLVLTNLSITITQL
jgi:hypothetical protein